MNPKIFAAFAGGVLLASTFAYFAAKSPSSAAPPKVVEARPNEPAPAPEPPPVMADNTPAPAPVPAPPPPPRKATVNPSPVRRTVPQPPPAAPAPVVTRDPEPAPAPAPSSQPVQVSEAPKYTPEPPLPPPPPVKAPEPPKPNTVTIPAGTVLSVRLQDSLSSEKNAAGDTFQAVLDAPLVIDGFVIADKGAKVEGRLSEVDRSGRVKGVARMVLELSRLSTSDGQRVDLRTENFESKAESSKKGDAAKVGIGAAIGAAIGAIAGGGKGAAVGAGAGGAAGAGGVLLTRGKAAEIPVETRLTFRLADYVTLTERLNR